MNKTGVIPIITVEDIAPYLVPIQQSSINCPASPPSKTKNKAKQNINCHATKTNSPLDQNA
jgi:hypothetical protein